MTIGWTDLHEHTGYLEGITVLAASMDYLTPETLSKPVKDRVLEIEQSTREYIEHMGRKGQGDGISDVVHRNLGRIAALRAFNLIPKLETTEATVAE